MNGHGMVSFSKGGGKNGGGWCGSLWEGGDAWRSWSEPSKWIPGGGGQFRGPLISGPVRAEQLT